MNGQEKIYVSNTLISVDEMNLLSFVNEARINNIEKKKKKKTKFVVVGA